MSVGHPKGGEALVAAMDSIVIRRGAVLCPQKEFIVL